MNDKPDFSDGRLYPPNCLYFQRIELSDHFVGLGVDIDFRETTKEQRSIIAAVAMREWRRVIFKCVADIDVAREQIDLWDKWGNS